MLHKMSFSKCPKIPQRLRWPHSPWPGWNWVMSPPLQRWTRCLPTDSPLLEVSESSCAHAGQNHPPPAQHRGPPIALPQPSLPQDCHRSMAEPRMSLSHLPQLPCSSTGRDPVPWMDASTGSLLHLLLLPQGISAGAPALQGEHRAARAAVNPSLQLRALPSSPFHPNLWKSRSLPATAQHNCEVEQAVLASCSKGSCSLSLPLPQPVTLRGPGTGTSLHRQSSSSTVCLLPIALPNLSPRGAPQTSGRSMRPSMDSHSQAQTPLCASPSPCAPQCWQGCEPSPSWDRMEGSGRETRARS